MNQLCLSTNLSSSDMAAWASAVATAVGSIGTLIAIIAAYKLGRRSERLAERTRLRERAQSELRDITLVQLCIREARAVLQVAANMSADGDTRPLSNLASAMESVHDTLSECTAKLLPPVVVPLLWQAIRLTRRNQFWLALSLPDVADSSFKLVSDDIAKLTDMEMSLEPLMEALSKLNDGLEASQPL